jgi:hypothetical protein
MQDSFDPIVNVTKIPGFSEPSVTYSVKEQRRYWSKWAKTELVGKVVNHSEVGDIVFTSSGIKEALNQPHDDLPLKYSVLKDILTLLKSAKYLRS